MHMQRKGTRSIALCTEKSRRYMMELGMLLNAYATKVTLVNA